MAATKLGYNPQPDHEEIVKDSLIDLSSIDSNKEFWLLQWPTKQELDFDGQEVSLKLNGDGTLGSFVSRSGKSYELVSFAPQQPDATVFQSSKTGSKVVGKISRRVSLIHFPEPSELDKSNSQRSAQFYQRSAATSSKGTSRRSRHTSSSGLTQFTAIPSRISRQTTSLFEFGGSSKRPKKNHNAQPAQGSTGRDQSDVSSLGSLGNSGMKQRTNKHEK